MQFAIFSDIHDNLNGFHRTLSDAEQAGADRLVFLGDAGRDTSLLTELRQREILCICGNWEVSGVRRMSGELAEWVGQWPVTSTQGQAIFCHATPDMPTNAHTTVDLLQLTLGGMGWAALFPRVLRNEDAVWRAMATLEERELRVAFHGHTHVQAGWIWAAQEGAAQRQLRPFTGAGEFALEPAPARYLIGVGSAGAPQDGTDLRYALYDDATHTVTLRSIR